MGRKKCGFFLIFLWALTPLIWADEGGGEDPAARYFFYRCAGCHTVGGGQLSGPDLQPATQWNEGDLQTAIKRMENRVGPIAADEMNQLIQFLRNPDVAERLAKQKADIEAKQRASLPAASFEIGAKLFTGHKAFVNGGPACMACHSTGDEGGATLGPSLARLKERFSNLALQSAIENSNFKMMRPIYAKHKITTEEALHLTEYLMHPEKQPARAAVQMPNIIFAAAAGFGVSVLLLWQLNRKVKKSARSQLFKKDKG